jgi:hypothetical protein
LSGEGHSQNLTDPQRKSGQVFDDSRVEENDGQGGSESQLEAQIKQAEGVENKKKKGGDGQSVDQINFSPDKLPEKKGESHHYRPHHRRASLDEQGIEKKKDNHQKIRDTGWNPDQLEKRKNQEGDDGNVGTGYGDEMVEP